MGLWVPTMLLLLSMLLVLEEVTIPQAVALSAAENFAVCYSDVTPEQGEGPIEIKRSAEGVSQSARPLESLARDIAEAMHRNPGHL